MPGLEPVSGEGVRDPGPGGWGWALLWLAATDLLSVFLFGLIVHFGFLHRPPLAPPAAAGAAIAGALVLMTALWLATERDVGAGLPFLRRAGRAVAAYALAVFLAPGAVLAFLDFIGRHLPASAGIAELQANAMVLLLAAIVLLTVSQAAALLWLLGTGLPRRRPGPPSGV
jgi:uncharacterized membrane protein